MTVERPSLFEREEHAGDRLHDHRGRCENPIGKDHVLVSADDGADVAAQIAGEPIFVDKTDDATLIRICDDGPGIPAEVRDKLFQPFASRSSEGTGLGLAIVAKIMAAHHGSVSLTQRDDFTTCFTLRFPTRALS